MLDPWTALRYTAAVARAAPAIEARLTPAVLANRVVRSRTRPPSLDIEPVGRARARFVALAAGLCRSPFVALADVENCYPSITAGSLGRALAAAGVDDGAIAAVAQVLADLSAAGVRGLPVGPAPSAVLANAVLAAVDERLRADGRVHLRWVDDVWVAADTRRDADRVLESIAASLEELGLRLSTRKTRVAAGDAVRPDGLSPARAQYHRPAHAHPLPGVPGSDAVAPRRG